MWENSSLNFRDKIFPFSATLPISWFYGPFILSMPLLVYCNTVLSNSNVSFNSTLYLSEKPY